VQPASPSSSAALIATVATRVRTSPN
jgi:hypothetical protein